MHQKRSPWPGIAAFCLVLLLVPLYWLFGPEKTFSPSERRYLAERPDITKQDVMNSLIWQKNVLEVDKDLFSMLSQAQKWIYAKLIVVKQEKQ